MVTITGPDMLLTRAEAAEVAAAEVPGCDKERIRTWERRGHLERAGLNEDGQPVYTAVAVAVAAHKLRRFTRVAALPPRPIRVREHARVLAGQLVLCLLPRPVLAHAPPRRPALGKHLGRHVPRLRLALSAAPRRRRVVAQHG